MKRITLERMPLHSSAISMVTLGSTIITPSRENGILTALKNQSVTTAELYCRNTMTRWRHASGNGVIKTRKPSGNNPAQTAFLPKENQNAAIQQPEKRRMDNEM